jgi:hypothetical protein
MGRAHSSGCTRAAWCEAWVDVLLSDMVLRLQEYVEKIAPRHLPPQNVRTSPPSAVTPCCQIFAGVSSAVAPPWL